MLKRTLIVAALFAAQSGVALADNNWPFDDAYWKNPVASGMATTHTSSAAANAVNAEFAKYQQVDGYNY